jgi:hypothetical protein
MFLLLLRLMLAATVSAQTVATDKKIYGRNEVVVVSWTGSTKSKTGSVFSLQARPTSTRTVIGFTVADQYHVRELSIQAQ